MKRKLLLVLLPVLVVQILLTLMVFTTIPHDGGDNAGYISLAHSLLERGAYLELWDPLEPPHTKYPPVFPLLLAGIIAVGVKGWVGLKVVPVASTILAGLLTFLWAKERGGLVMGAGVALLLSLSSGVLYYSHWILSDPTFLALTVGAWWALERWEASRRARAGDGEGPPEEGLSAPEGGGGWLALGLTLVILAYFTRSAGLPLVAATLLWLGWKGRWRALGALLVAFGIPAFLWWLRTRGVGGGEYVSEFWLANPYQPELGQVGVGGLLARVAQNLVAYTTKIIPAGIVGVGDAFHPILGVGLVILALLGWMKSLKERGGVGELFFPLYGSLILLWPVVWSGDRFALPFLPLLLLYSAVALLWLLKRVDPWVRRGTVGLLFGLVAVPSLFGWSQEVRENRACNAAVRGGDPYGCYASGAQEYAALAQWTGLNLPDGALVVTRKPRIFYLLSGVKAQSVPFVQDPDEFLHAARSEGSGYLILDWWDSVTRYYVLPVVQARVGAFCYITGVGASDEVGTILFGLVQPTEVEEEGAEPGLVDCPLEVLREAPRQPVPVAPGQIPLLVWGAG